MTATEGLSPDTILSTLRRLAEAGPGERATFAELVARLDARAHALVVLLLAAPNLTPGPSVPGFSTLFGLPLCVVAFEIALGRRTLRLPGFLARRSVPRRHVARFIDRLIPLVMRVERVLKPRWLALTGPVAERRLGLACLLQGVLLSLPIPVYSYLPAISLVLIALGLMARDGMAVAAGLAVGVVALGALVALVAIAVMALAG